MKGLWIRFWTCPVARSSPNCSLAEELRRGRTRESLAVAVVDLDGLGAVNKLHGAAVGTHLLRTTAEVLHQTVRGIDEIARTGADEFSVLLMPPTPSTPPPGKSASRTCSTHADATSRPAR